MNFNKYILSTLFFGLVTTLTFGQKIPQKGKFLKFLKSNQGVALYFHGAEDPVIPEGEILSWDWDNYSIQLKRKSSKKMKNVKFPEYSDKAGQEPIALFSICLNDRVICPVMAAEDKLPVPLEYPYINTAELKKKKLLIQLHPSNAEFKELLKECRADQEEAIELAKDDSKSRLFFMEIFNYGDQLCKNLIVNHLLLYDKDLKLYLEEKKLIKVSE